MHVYFVRHGETLLNTKHMHQSPITPLSPKGREEMLTTAEYLRGVNPDRIFTSEYTRARESAGILGMVLGIQPEVQSMLYEIIRPSKFYEKSRFSPETFLYMLLLVLHRKDKIWHYKDGENLIEMKNRARRAILFIESLHGTSTSVIIVSHTGCINFMIALMCRDSALGIMDLFRAYITIETMSNGEVIHVEYTGTKREGVCPWRRVD